MCLCIAAASQARDGDLRLNGHGASRFSGRLEIFYNGEWGTVCAAADAQFFDFDYKAGSVACRQMGLGNVVDVYSIHNFPGLRYIRTINMYTPVFTFTCGLLSSLSLSLSLSLSHSLMP